MKYQKVAKDLFAHKQLNEHSLHVFFKMYELLPRMPQGSLSRQQERDLLVAALLHDIGKSNWLEEWHTEPIYLLPQSAPTVMRMHPLQGANILSEAGVGEDVVRLVREHHERPRGSGYPMRAEPGFASLVLAACDVFAACTEEREYRQQDGACSVDETIRAVSEFAPKAVVEALLGTEDILEKTS